MPEESFEEKTEKATPKKREEVRKKGEVAKSRELSSVAVLLCGLITMAVFGSYMYTHIQTIIKGTISLAVSNDMGLPELMSLAQKTVVQFILAIGPFFIAIVITAVFSNIIQVGFMLSGEMLKPKLSKLDPIKGFERLFSKQALMELFKSLVKLGIIGGVAYMTVKGEIKNVHLLGDMELKAMISYILITILKISIRCTLAMVFLVVIDFAFQKWEFEKKIRMTKKEIKDELKRTEGDPLVKSRIRSVQMQMARRRMMQEVPEADVVITNPTHLAVALKYDSSVMDAPKVLAKGAGEIAKKIKELAQSHGVPVLENKELAQNLYALVEIDQEIPPSLYQTVAEVLAYIYKLKNHHAYANF